MDRSRVAIIIPAFNEARTIGQVATAVSAYGVPIVISDGSSDATAATARDSGAQVIELQRNRGYDGALNAGFAHAAQQGFDYMLTVDADGQHNPAHIAAFVQLLDDGADVVVGVRDRHQRWGERLFSLVGRMRWGLQDPLCGMKAYRLKVYQALGHFDAYHSIGTELALFAVRHGFKVAQLPVATAERTDAPRFGNGWKPNMRIVRALSLGLIKQ